MNLSLKFILQQLSKLKLLLLGYAVIIGVSFSSTFIAHNIYKVGSPFTTLLLLTVTFLPPIILTIATLQFFAFRSDRAYHLFLSTVPIPPKKQFSLLVFTLMSLAFVFSFIAFICTLYFNSIMLYYSVISLPFDQTCNVCIIYFITLLLFTSILIFLKVLLIHNRAFYIALFLGLLSTFIISIFPLKLFLNKPLGSTLFPLPFNFLEYSRVSFPILSMNRVIFLILLTLLFTWLTFYLYKEEVRNHTSEKTQKVATMIIYTVILTPALYVMYFIFDWTLFIIALFVLFILALSIIKITFKKFILTAVLIPFLIASGITIPLGLATQNLFAMQMLNEWEKTQFKEADYVSFDLTNIQLFNKKRSVHILIPKDHSERKVLKALHDAAQLKFVDNYTQFSPSTANSESSLSTSQATFIIQWHSLADQLTFTQYVENIILAADKTGFDISASIQLKNNSDHQTCYLSLADPTQCLTEDNKNRKLPTIQKAIELVDQRISTAKDIESYAISFNTSEFSNNFRIIILS